MRLTFGLEETVIPGVLASRGIPVVLSEHRPAHQARYVEIMVPASRLEEARLALADAKRIGKLMDQETGE
jgi:hypothetical protein